MGVNPSGASNVRALLAEYARGGDMEGADVHIQYLQKKILGGRRGNMQRDEGFRTQNRVRPKI